MWARRDLNRLNNPVYSCLISFYYISTRDHQRGRQTGVVDISYLMLGDGAKAVDLLRDDDLKKHHADIYVKK